MAKKETTEDILKTIMEKGSSKAASQAAKALEQTETPIEEPKKQKTSKPKSKPQPNLPPPEELPANKGILSNLTENLKKRYSKAGGTKGIAKKGVIGAAKGIGKLALGGLKLGAGAALGIGGIVAGGTINALGLSEIAGATIAGTAAVNGLFNKRNENVSSSSSERSRSAGSSSTSINAMAAGIQGLQASIEQLVSISNSILSSTQENTTAIQDVVTAIDRQTGNFEANVRTTNDILKQINASILGSKTGGAPSPEKNNGLLAGLMSVVAAVMDGLKFIKGLLDVAIKSIFKAGSLIESLFKGIGRLFTRGGAKVAAETGTALAAEGAEKLAEKGATEIAGKGALEVAEKGTVEVAGKGALNTLGSIATGAAKGAGKLGLKAIPIIGDVAIGALQAAESGSIGEGIAAGLGSFGGRIAGGAAGSVVGPVGTVVGEVGGSIAGAEGAAALYRWFSGENKKETSSDTSSENNPMVADDLTNRLETMHTAGVINDNIFKMASDDIKNGKYSLAEKIIIKAENSVAPSGDITANQNGISVTPTPNNSNIPFNQQSAQLALNNNTTTPPPVIINNNNTTMGGSVGGSNNPPRSSGAVSTSPNQSHIDRVLYGDLYGAGVP